MDRADVLGSSCDDKTEGNREAVPEAACYGPRMFRDLPFAALSALVLAGPAAAFQAPQTEEPSAMLLAQAWDRCMTEHAVRLTHTPATDEAIYLEAASGCDHIKARVFAAVGRDLPRSEATQLTSAFDAQAKPNFLTMLRRIRADRAARKQD